MALRDSRNLIVREITTTPDNLVEGDSVQTAIRKLRSATNIAIHTVGTPTSWGDVVGTDTVSDFIRKQTILNFRYSGDNSTQFTLVRLGGSVLGAGRIWSGGSAGVGAGYTFRVTFPSNFSPGNLPGMANESGIPLGTWSITPGTGSLSGIVIGQIQALIVDQINRVFDVQLVNFPNFTQRRIVGLNFSYFLG
jgi:hypothetical protein